MVPGLRQRGPGYTRWLNSASAARAGALGRIALPTPLPDVTKPYEFIGFGAIEVTKPYEFIGFGAIEVAKPYKFLGFGAMEVTKPYEFYRVWGHRCHQTL